MTRILKYRKQLVWPWTLWEQNQYSMVLLPEISDFVAQEDRPRQDEKGRGGLGG